MMKILHDLMYRNPRNYGNIVCIGSCGFLSSTVGISLLGSWVKAGPPQTGEARLPGTPAPSDTGVPLQASSRTRTGDAACGSDLR